jgi:hypothetical protein
MTLSAHKRVVSPAARTKLLHAIAKQVKKDAWMKEELYNTIWEQEYQIVADSYTTKFQKYANLWLASDAGKAYQSYVQKSRYRLSPSELTYRSTAKKIQGDLQPEQLLFYKPPSGKATVQPYKGITLGIDEIRDIFAILENTVDVGPIEQASESDDSSSDEATLWFEMDIANLRKDKSKVPAQHTSWYARFSSVSTTVITNIIYFHCNIYSQAGRRTELTDASLQNLIRCVDTPGKHTPWPLMDSTLAEWKQFFDSTPEIANADRPSQDQMDLDSFKKGEPDLPQKAQISNVTIATDVKRNQARETFRMELDAARVPTTDLSLGDILSAESFPPASFSPDPMPAYYFRYMHTDLHEQTALHNCRLDHEINRLGLLQHRITSQIADLQMEKDTLLKKCRAIQGIEASLGSLLVENSQTVSAVAKMNQRVSDFERRPRMAGALQHEMSRKQTPRTSLSGTASPISHFPLYAEVSGFVSSSYVH